MAKWKGADDWTGRSFEGSKALKLFTVSSNGKKLFEVEDETLADAGGVRVWTKADSVTLFDDFTFGIK